MPTVRDDCFGGERLLTLDDARATRAGTGACEEYGMRRHTPHAAAAARALRGRGAARAAAGADRALRHPALVRPQGRPATSSPRSRKALYSLPLDLRRPRRCAPAPTASSSASTTRGMLVKTHPRKPPGERSIDPADFPPEKLAYALRDVAFFVRQAARARRARRPLRRGARSPGRCRGRACGASTRSSASPRYGDARVDARLQTALAADMLDVHRLADLVPARHPPRSPAAAQVIPLARYLRPASQYALPLARRERPNEGDDP